MLLSFHPQGCNAGRLAVGLAVQLVAIDAGADAGAAKEAAHVRLPHMAAGTRDTQEFGDSSGGVGMSMGGHAGRHRVTGHYAGRHGGGGTVVADPGRILYLRWGGGE